jgi:hypothetical protein
MPGSFDKLEKETEHNPEKETEHYPKKKRKISLRKKLLLILPT